MDELISSGFEEGLSRLLGTLAIISMRFEAPRSEKPSMLIGDKPTFQSRDNRLRNKDLGRSIRDEILVKYVSNPFESS